MNTNSLLVYRPRVCPAVALMSLVCLQITASFYAEAQIPTPSPTLPQDILNSSQNITSTTFASLSNSTKSVSVFVDITHPSPSNLLVRVFPGFPETGTAASGNPIFVLWDHEQLVDANNQPVTHIQATAVLPFAGDFPDLFTDPPTYTYTVQAIDDTFGHGFGNDQTIIGTFTSCTLTFDPSNPGHVGPPIVNLYAGSVGQPIPAEIDFGVPLNLIATAAGNPSSYKIARLGLVITEIKDPSDTSGLDPQIYRSPVKSQASASNSGVSLPYTSPLLAPGNYQIVAKAVDEAGFQRITSTNLKVKRIFGLTGANVSKQSNNTFSGLVFYRNDSPVDSGDLRVRLVEVATASFHDVNGPPDLSAYPPAAPAQASVSPTPHPLPAGTGDQVGVSGVVRAFIEVDPGNQYINFHVFAILDELVDGQWITVDSLRIVDGDSFHVEDFGGPGGGMNDPSPGLGGTSFDPLILNSLAINGLMVVPDSAQPSYTATATAKNSPGTTSKSADVTALSQWSANCPGGVFHPPHVTGDTAVQISASYTLAGVTRVATKSVTVTSATPTPTATPIVHVSVSPTQVTEGGSATFQISASPNTVRPIAVNYSLSGKSTFGVDYTLSGGLGQSGQITIPLGADSTAVTLTAVADQLKEKKESVTMTLNAGTGYKASKPKKAKLKFVDAP